MPTMIPVHTILLRIRCRDTTLCGIHNSQQSAVVAAVVLIKRYPKGAGARKRSEHTAYLPPLRVQISRTSNKRRKRTTRGQSQKTFWGTAHRGEMRAAGESALEQVCLVGSSSTRPGYQVSRDPAQASPWTAPYLQAG